MICPFCKSKFPKDFKWCMECGGALETDAGQYDALLQEEAISIPETKTDFGELFKESEMSSHDSAIAGKVTCTVCGANVDSRDAFCGECGEPATKAESKVTIPLVSSSPMPAKSQQTAQPMKSKQPPEYFSPPPPMPVTVMPCPNCGMEVSSDEAFCGTCGFSVGDITPQAAILHKPLVPDLLQQTSQQIEPIIEKTPAQPSFIEPIPQITTSAVQQSTITNQPSTYQVTEPAVSSQQIPTHQIPESSGPLSQSSIFQSQSPVCSVCGIEGAASDTFCQTCGTPYPDTGKSAASPQAQILSPPSPTSSPPFPSPQIQSMPQQAEKPTAPSPHPTAASSEGKACFCCGVQNPAGSTFCSNCGIDF